MKRMIRVFSCLLIILFGLSFIGCTAQTAPPANAIMLTQEQIAPFVGTWYDRWIGETSFTLSKDGTLIKEEVSSYKKSSSPVTWYLTSDGKMQISGFLYTYSFDGKVLKLKKDWGGETYNQYYELTKEKTTPILHVEITEKGKKTATESILAAKMLYEENELRFTSKYKGSKVVIYSTVEDISGPHIESTRRVNSSVNLTGNWFIDTSGYESVINRLNKGDIVKVTGYVDHCFVDVSVYKIDDITIWNR